MIGENYGVILSVRFRSSTLVDVGLTLLLIVTAVKTCIKNSGAGGELLKCSIDDGGMLGTYMFNVALSIV